MGPGLRPCRRASARRGSRNHPDLTDHIPYIFLNARNKRSKRSRPALNPLQMRFPLPGHRRALDLRMHHLNQPDPLLRSLQVLPAARNILALQQHLNNGSPSSRGAQTAVLHGIGQFLLIERLARRLHGGQQRGFGKPLRRASLLPNALGVQNILSLSTLQPGRKSLIFFRLSPRRLHIEHLPPELLDHLPRRVISVGHLAIHNRRDHRRHRPHMIRVPGAQQPSANQIVNPALVGA